MCDTAAAPGPSPERGGIPRPGVGGVVVGGGEPWLGLGRWKAIDLVEELVRG